MSSLIANLVLPDIQSVYCPELYFRGDWVFESKTQEIHVFPTKPFESSTYFNGLSTFHIKSKTKIKKLKLSISVKEGSGFVELMIADRLGVTRTIGAAQRFEGGSTIKFDIDLATAGVGIIFYKVLASEKVVITSAVYSTPTAPARQVNVAIVITTFKRETMTMSAIARLRESTIVAEGHQLYVIDNGQSLDASSGGGIHIIHNENLGGAGGFMRGMLEAERAGKFSHVLFMDDDASSHSESILRSIRMIGFVKDDRIAISGAMLLDHMPYVQHEGGSKMTKLGIKPMRNGRDLRKLAVVVANEDDETTDYGAWWYFLFPLNKVKIACPPFFVRGDDIFFGYFNDFKTITMNGVCSWQESFDNKNSTATVYLSARSNMAIALYRYVKGEVSILKIADSVFSTSFRHALAFRYAHAEVSLKAWSDAFEGATYWQEHSVPFAKLAPLKKAHDASFPHPIDYSFGAASRGKKPGIIGKFLFWVTLNGHLLPNFLLNKRLKSVFGFGVRNYVTFGSRRVRYVRYDGLTGFEVQKSLGGFFRVAGLTLSFLFKLIFCRRKIRDGYGKDFEDLTTRDYWLNRLKMK
jgi:galactofuranosylgalactofuranosylrhamnosyl-N-acetylglucosaminyl-diphospho-decaprenol beta-1,5/1,6-galactofuranosyltransferase